MNSRSEQLMALAKRQGVTSIARVIVEEPDKYAKALSEEEFCNMLMTEAIAWQKTGESIGQAFSKLFQAQTPEGLLLRQAHAAINKAHRPELPTATPVSKSAGSAYDQLVEKAGKLRQLEPGLSLTQAFSKVYQDPKNIELANRERQESRPVSTIYPNGGERQ